MLAKKSSLVTTINSQLQKSIYGFKAFKCSGDNKMIELTFTNVGVSFNTKGVADPTIELCLRDSAGDLSVVDGQNTTGLDTGREAVIGNQPMSDVGSNPTYPTIRADAKSDLFIDGKDDKKHACKPDIGSSPIQPSLQSQCDPAESEGFSKLTNIQSFSTPSPADDNYISQSSSAEDNRSYQGHLLGTPDNLQSSDAHTSIHDMAGKSILTPPHSQPPAVSSKFHSDGIYCFMML